MLFIVRLIDKSESLAVREQFLPDHLEWLDEYQSTVLIAGSLRAEAGTDPTGAFWIVDAENKEEIENLLHTDPFWKHGLRESYEILHWSKAFPERRISV